MLKAMQKWGKPLFLLSVFLLMVIHFTQVAPIVIINMDDWHYLQMERTALPSWAGWNPSRILPELLMPITAALSARLIYPLSGDFIRSVELGISLMVSGFITLYMGAFLHLIRKKYNASCGRSLLLAMFFFLFHFLIFRVDIEGNDYLLRGRYDTCTFFFYLIPALWNASLVMFMSAEDYFRTRKDMPAAIRAIAAAAVYLGVFSNVFQAGILAVYTGLDLVFTFAGNLRAKTGKPLKGLGSHFSILLLFLISLVFESSGGRATSSGTRELGGLFVNLQQAFSDLAGRLVRSNKWFLLVLALTLGFALFRLIPAGKKANRRKGEAIRPAVRMLTCAGVTLLYLLVMSAASFPFYIARGDVLVCSMFFLFLFMIDQIHAIILTPRFSSLALIVLIVLAVQTNTPDRTWGVSTYESMPPETSRALMTEIIETCVEADRRGESSVEVKVPLFNYGSNWPIAPYGSDRMAGVLYRYGLTQKNMDLTLIPAEEKNHEYHLPLPEPEPVSEPVS